MIDAILIYFILSGIFCTYKVYRGGSDEVPLGTFLVMGWYVVPAMVFIFGPKILFKRWNGTIW